MRDSPLLEMQEKLLKIADKEMERTGEKPWLGSGKPGRWFDDPHWRCPNGHVGTMFIKSEEKGDLCVLCHENVLCTFPEDKDGLLEEI